MEQNRPKFKDLLKSKRFWSGVIAGASMAGLIGEKLASTLQSIVTLIL